MAAVSTIFLTINLLIALSSTSYKAFKSYLWYTSTTVGATNRLYVSSTLKLTPVISSLLGHFLTTCTMREVWKKEPERNRNQKDRMNTAQPLLPKSQRSTLKKLQRTSKRDYRQ